LGRTLRLVMRRRFRAMLRLPISWPKGSVVDSRFLTRPDERLGQIQILHQQRGNCFSAWTLPQRNPVRNSCAASPGRQASKGDLAVAHHERTGRFGPAPLAGPKRVRCARLTKSPQAALARHPLPARSESFVRGSQTSPQAAQSKPPCDYSPQANEKKQRSTTTAPCSRSKLREHRQVPTALSTPRQFPRTPANRTSERLQLQDYPVIPPQQNPPRPPLQETTLTTHYKKAVTSLPSLIPNRENRPRASRNSRNSPPPPNPPPPRRPGASSPGPPPQQNPPRPRPSQTTFTTNCKKSALSPIPLIPNHITPKNHPPPHPPSPGLPLPPPA